MVRIYTQAGWKQIDRLFEAGSMVGLTDRELLDRFLAGESVDAAFEALVDRHGPMVRSVCRSVLRDAHEADDAFQAVFLVLASRARAIRRRDVVGSWLYGVACRVAARARADAGRRHQLERYLAERVSHKAPMTWRPSEPMPEVLEEVERLPERYRAPIVLCYLEGQSHEQAARTLGCPLRTVQTRLERGKARLRTRLVRRGLSPAVGLLAIGVESAAAAPVVLACTVPAALSESTVRVSMQFATSHAAGLATTAIGLARGVIRTLFWNRLQRAAGVVFGLAMGLALSFFAFAPAAQRPDKPAQTITGRILDDQGRPIAGADVWMPVWYEDNADRTSHATADTRGIYVLTIPETWFRSPIHERQSVLWAYAPGHRIASANAGRALAGKPGSVDLTLGTATDTSFVVRGPDGRPAVGAVVEPYRVFVTTNVSIPPPAAMLPAISSVTDETGRAMLPAIGREGFASVKVTTSSLGEQQFQLRGRAAEPARREVRLRAGGRIEGHIVAGRPEWARRVKIYLSTTSRSDRSGQGTDEAEGLAEVTTGDDGTFIVPAIAEGKLSVHARVDQTLPARPRPIGEVAIRSKQTTKFAIFLQKAVRVRGSIRVKDSHEPVAGASIGIDYGVDNADQKGQGQFFRSTSVSDGRGQFETYIMPGEAQVRVIGLPEPFARLARSPERVFHVRDVAEFIELPPVEVARGVTITGRLVDAQDQPIADARVFVGDAFTITDRRGDFTISGVPAGPKATYRVNITPQDKISIDAEIARENPLLLRAPIKTPTRTPEPPRP